MRLFFGLSLPDDIRLAAAKRADDCRLLIPGRYALEENYHITLAFLGDVPQDRLADAQRVLAHAVCSTPAPLLTLGGTGYFGRQQNGILILRVSSEPMLDSLHDALVEDLLAAGLPVDRGPFSPHITLARHACVPDGPLPGGKALRFRPTDAHVFLSARGDDGVLRYTPLFSSSFHAP